MLSDISLIIKTFERRNALERLLDSIRDQGYTECPILIADDSREPYQDAITEKYGDIVDEYLVLPFNSGLSKGRNALLDRVDTEYFVLNDDDFVYSDHTDILQALADLRSNSLDILSGYTFERQTKPLYPWLPTRLTRLLGLQKEYWQQDLWSADIELTDDRGVVVRTQPEFKTSPQKCDMGLNFFIARTHSVRDVVNGWNPLLKSIGEHWEFFYRCKQAGLRVACSNAFGVYHNRDSNPDYDAHRFSNEDKMIKKSLNHHNFRYLKRRNMTYTI